MQVMAALSTSISLEPPAPDCLSLCILVSGAGQWGNQLVVHIILDFSFFSTEWLASKSENVSVRKCPRTTLVS